MINSRRSEALHHILAVVVLALLVACGPTYIAPPVTTELAKRSPVPKTRLERGYEIHQVKCAKCHTFEDPADYEPDELEFDIMPEMARKSKLSDADAKAVLEYLLAARKVAPENAPQ